ncbi:hypothetical protein ACFYO1_32425 [Nocardia sp. NPDC006044]|uniref:hypothetical protein n=1 Tax=Nocardia sp. NPDC006044 TaxID=3364306 RepID=UPI0036B3375A
MTRPDSPTHAPFAVRAGLATLEDDAVALRCALDATFEGWALQAGAARQLFPPLIAVAELAGLDYFRNFPHLAVLATGLRDTETQQRYAESTLIDEVPGSDLRPAQYALPSAACFNVYLALRDSTIEQDRRITTVSSCFRREQEYHERRLLGFTMREVVCVGANEAVIEHVQTFKKTVLAFADAIGLPLEVEASSDPFFEASGPRKLMQQLFPVKEEFVYTGGGGPVAIGSINFHRNFFGERCAITLGDGSFAFSGCAAFGLERWLSVLLEQFGASALDRVIEAKAGLWQ